MSLHGTHTFALMEVSKSTYNEISSKLKEAGYEHAFVDCKEDGIVLDMHGIGVKAGKQHYPGRTLHELKTWPTFYADVISGHKTFELRKNDRGFECGDVLNLREWDPETREYTGRNCYRHVSIIITKFAGLAEGYVLMGLVPA